MAKGHFELEARRMSWIALIPVTAILLSILGVPWVRRVFGW
jgi:hypothetical protein